MAGTKEAELCAQHATEGMVDVSKKKCGYQGCSTRANYGVEGTKGRILLAARQARHGGLEEQEVRSSRVHLTHPSFGVEGTKKAQLCSQHAREGVVCLAGKRCGHQGCPKQASYGTPRRYEESRTLP